MGKPQAEIMGVSESTVSANTAGAVSFPGREKASMIRLLA
jgi:hypothetical protein